MGITNKTITTGGVAENFLTEGHNWGGLIITALTEDGWINFGANAGADNGEKLYKDSPAKFSAKEFPGFNQRVSVFSATTGAKFTLRQTS